VYNIKVGDRLEMRFKKEGEVPKIYLSQVYDFSDKNSVVVHTPISYGKYVALTPKQPCSLLFFLGEGMMSFEAVVVKTFMEESFSLEKLQFTSEGEKMQRREFFRFECTLPIRFSVISPEVDTDRNPPTQQPLREGIIKDIGGGGLRFVSNADVESGENIKCLLLLEREYIVVIGKILHKYSFPRSPYKYQYRVIFVGILPEEKEKIVQYVFNQQRSLLSKQRHGMSAKSDS